MNLPGGGAGRWAAAVLAAGVLVLTGCSAASEGTDDTAAPSGPTTSASVSPTTSASSPTSSQRSSSGQSSSGPSPTAPSTSSSDATPSDDPGTELPTSVLPTAAPAPSGSVEIGIPGTDPTEDAPLSEECAGISTATMAQWVGGPAFDAADDITIDPELGDSSCIFSTLTGSHSVLVERNQLQTYLGGELAALPEAEAMTQLEQALTLSSTDPEITSVTVGGRAATVITATTFTGGTNGMAFTVVDGALVIVTAEGDELSSTDGGLGGTAARILEQVLTL